MFTAASVLLRHRALLVACAATGMLAAVAFAALRPAKYVSSVSFVPESPRPTAIGTGAPLGPSGLASALGAAIGSDDSDSPAFYLELLRSRAVLDRLAADTFVVADASSRRSGTLAQLLDLGNDPGVGRERAARWLERHAIWAGERRGVVEVRVTTHFPELSHQLAVRTLAAVSDFNVGRRQRRAAAERRFLEGRVVLAREELRSAEEALQRFLDANRVFDTSPELRLRHGALRADVEARQSVLSALLQRYEQARIEEVRNIPVISVINRPQLPHEPEPRRIPFAAMAGLLTGGAIATIIAFMRAPTEIGRGSASPHRPPSNVLAVRPGAAADVPTS